MKKVVFIIICLIIMVIGLFVFLGYPVKIASKLEGPINDFIDGLGDSYVESSDLDASKDDGGIGSDVLEDDSQNTQDTQNIEPVIGESFREKTPLELENDKRDTYEERLKKDEMSQLIYDNFNMLEFRVPKVYGNSFVIESNRYVIGDRSKAIKPTDPEFENPFNLEYVSTVSVCTEDGKYLSLFNLVGMDADYCAENGISTEGIYINPLNNRAIFFEKNIDESIDNVGVYRTLTNSFEDIKNSFIHLN